VRALSHAALSVRRYVVARVTAFWTDWVEVLALEVTSSPTARDEMQSPMSSVEYNNVRAMGGSPSGDCFAGERLKMYM
jgi:hypothetical protein